jgi:hypothetical protein
LLGLRESETERQRIGESEAQQSVVQIHSKYLFAWTERIRERIRESESLVRERKREKERERLHHWFSIFDSVGRSLIAFEHHFPQAVYLCK